MSARSRSSGSCPITREAHRPLLSRRVHNRFADSLDFSKLPFDFHSQRPLIESISPPRCGSRRLQTSVAPSDATTHSRCSSQRARSTRTGARRWPRRWRRASRAAQVSARSPALSTHQRSAEDGLGRDVEDGVGKDLLVDREEVGAWIISSSPDRFDAPSASAQTTGYAVHRRTV